MSKSLHSPPISLTLGGNIILVEWNHLHYCIINHWIFDLRRAGYVICIRLRLILCVRAWLCAKYFKKLQTAFDNILWRGGMRPKEESITFWWWSGFCHGSWIIFQDSLPLADRASTDTLQCSSAIYERISDDCFVAVGRGPKTNWLDFGGNLMTSSFTHNFSLR